MSDENFCTNGGELVGMECWLPEDPSERFVARPDDIGCNRLLCDNCSSWVHHLDLLRLVVTSLPGLAERERMYLDLAAAAKSPIFAPSVNFRIYLCRCQILGAASAQFVEDNEVVQPKWRCAGHPRWVEPHPNPPQPATEAEVKAMLIDRAPGPPRDGDSQPWDFAMRWRQPFVIRVVWSAVAGFTTDRDPVLRKRALELISAWRVGDPITIGLLLGLATEHAILYQTPELRTLLANLLCQKALRLRGMRADIANAVTNLLAVAPPIEEAATFLSIVAPDTVIASAARWTEELADNRGAIDAASAMATYRRDHLLTLLRALAGRSPASRDAIAAAVAAEFARSDDGLDATLAGDGVPMPTTRPAVAEARAALGLAP